MMKYTRYILYACGIFVILFLLFNLLIGIFRADMFKNIFFSAELSERKKLLLQIEQKNTVLDSLENRIKRLNVIRDSLVSVTSQYEEKLSSLDSMLTDYTGIARRNLFNKNIFYNVNSPTELELELYFRRIIEERKRRDSLSIKLEQ